jgi:TfoX/Sxy family transcriptional regulator of competence genes
MQKTQVIHDIEMALTVSLANVAPDAILESRSMFGGAGFYAYGRMFGGYYGKGLALKLAESDRNDLLAVEGATRTQSPQYIEVPPTFLDDPALLDPWLIRSLEYIKSLPDKKRKRK